jgi:PAS domain S-box-containing protein
MNMNATSRQLLHDISQAVADLLAGKKPEQIITGDDADEVEIELRQRINQLIDTFAEIHAFILPLSQGQLNSYIPKRKNILSSPFKELHSRLLNLTWQAERIAEGDYHQRVDFMGDFSTAFNTMVAKLADRENALKEANERLEERVTERTAELAHANTLLKKSAEDWTRTFDAISDFVFILDNSGTILKTNQAFLDRFNLPREEVVGRKCHELLHSTEHFIDDCPFVQTLSSGKPHTLEIYDSTVGCPLLVTTSPIHDEHGELSGAVHIARDITMQKESQQALADLNAALEATVSRLEKTNLELNNFAYIAAHDLRTPLRGIVTLADWLSMDYGPELDKQGRDWLNMLTQRTRKMTRLIDAMQEYTSIGKTERKKHSVDLNVLMPRIIEQIQRPETVMINLVDSLPTLVCNPIDISEIFKHLIQNALVHGDISQRVVTIGGEEQAAHWVFYVSDNGPGIEKRYHQKIFQIFQTLKDPGDSESIGMGLALTKKMVEHHGGQLWVESEKGQGSRFFFTVPKGD